MLISNKLVLYWNINYVTEEAHIKLMNARTIVWRIIIDWIDIPIPCPVDVSLTICHGFTM